LGLGSDGLGSGVPWTIGFSGLPDIATATQNGAAA
jgi:hypothetical protein